MTRHGNGRNAPHPSARTQHRRRSSSCSSSSSSSSSSSGYSGASSVASMTMEPLDVMSITVPKDAIERRGEVTFFAVHVMPRSEVEPWVVMRRYNDFFALQRQLGRTAQSFADAPFPPKKPFGCKGQKLEDRRCGLEAWLRRSIEFANKHGEAWWSPLHDFLEAQRCMQATPRQHQNAVALVQVPSAPPPSQSDNVVPSAMQALHTGPKDARI